MIQTNGSGETATDTTPSDTNQPSSWFARHPQNVSDASLAEFEQLMAFMGYRPLEPVTQATSGATVTARGG